MNWCYFIRNHVLNAHNLQDIDLAIPSKKCHKKGVTVRPARDKKSTENTRDSPPYLRSSFSGRPTRMLGAGVSYPAFLLTHNRKHWSGTPHLRCCGCSSSSYEHCTIHLTILKLHYTDTRVLALTDIESFFLVAFLASVPAGETETIAAAQVSHSDASPWAGYVPVYIISLIIYKEK
ncbi:hypothetical protein ACJJTC_002595 [Scirpophaga incertulas]